MQRIALAKIRLDPSNPRQEKDPEAVRQLAANMKEIGLINAVEVDENDVLITGESRVLAARSLGWKTIPAKVIKRTKETYIRQLSENVVRKDMSPVDIAAAMMRMRQEGMTAVQIGEKFGVGRTTVQHYLALLNIKSDRIKNLLKTGISFKVVSLLNEIKDDEVRDELTGYVEKGYVRGWNSFVAVRRYLYATHDFKTAEEVLKSYPKRKSSGKRGDGSGHNDLALGKHFEEITPSVAKQMKQNLVPGQRLIGAISALSLALKQVDIKNVAPIHLGRLVTTYDILNRKMESLKQIEYGSPRLQSPVRK